MATRSSFWEYVSLKINHIRLRSGSFGEKWDAVSRLMESEITDEGLELLEKYSHDRNKDIRYRAAEALALTGSPKAESILLRLLDDKDNMVRVNACDSLGMSGTQRAIEPLKKHVGSTACNLERGYAVSSLADIAVAIGTEGEMTAFLETSLETEQDVWVRNHYYRSLYPLGKGEYLQLLLDSLDDENYQNRCEVVNLLSDIADDSNVETICVALKERLSKEEPDSIAVITTIEKTLNLLGSPE